MNNSKKNEKFTRVFLGVERESHVVRDKNKTKKDYLYEIILVV